MKNIVKIYLLLIMIAAFAMVSCEKEEQEQYPGGVGGYVPISDMTIHPLGENNLKVKFISNTSWKISGVPDWITVSKSSGGSGSYPINFTVQPCYIGSDGVSGNKRTATITFQNTDTKETIQSFKIEQECASIKVGIVGAEEGDSNVSFGWQKNDNVKEISIDSSVEYTVTINNNADFAIETEGTKNIFPLTDDNGVVKGYFVNLDGAKTKPQFTITPKDYNFDSDYNTAAISVTPVRSKSNGEGYNELSNVDKDLPKSLSVSQDFLIYKVFAGSIDDVEIKDNSKVVEFGEISELGHTYLNSNQSNDDNDLAMRTIVIVAESGVEYEVPGEDADDCKFVKDNTAKAVVSDRNVILTEYNVQVLKPNPNGNNVNDIEIPIPITGYEDEEDIPRLSVKLRQKPYVFQLVDANDNSEASEKVFENEGSSDMIYYTLKTSGPWEISNYNEDWLISDIEFNEDGKLSGEGNFTFGLKTDGRNMSFTVDNSVALLFSTGEDYFGDDLPTAYKSKLDVSQKKFEFDIKCGDKKSLTLTSSNTKNQSMSIISSGPWELQVSDNSEWLNISDLDGNDEGVYSGEAATDFNIQAEVNTVENSRKKTLKLISTLHREAGGYDEKDYTEEFIVTQDPLYCVILESDEENSNILEGFSNVPACAYEISDDDKDDLTRSFYLKCSVPWQVKSKPDWLKLPKTSGDGTDYETITITCDPNGNTKPNEESVVIQADIDGDGNYAGLDDRELSFTVNQDGFVFKTLSDAVSSYTFAAINNTEKKFSFEITKGAFNKIDDKNWMGLTLDKSESKDNYSSKTQKFTYSVKPVHNVGNGAEVNKSRNETVAISNKVNDTPINIIINQKAFVFKPNVTDLKAFNELPESDEKQSIEVEGDYKNVEVSCPNEVSKWLNVTHTDNSATWTFAPKDNNVVTTANSGKIDFIVKDVLENNKPIVLQTIDVVQNPYVWDVPDVNTDVKAVGEEKEITITSSGKWEISTPNNVPASPNSGNGKNGGKKVKSTITFPKHYDANDNEVTVTVICGDNDGLNKVFTFKQSAYEFDVKCGKDPVEDSYSKDVKAEGGDLVFDINCSDSNDWDYDVNSDGMIEVAKNKDNTKLTVTVSSNKGDGKKKTNERSCSINIFLKNGEEKVRTKTIKIKQEGYTPKK